MHSGPKELWIYETSAGKAPFTDWLNGLKDRTARAVIRVRLDRLEHGNPGRYESLSQGLYELKIYFGAGYRVYFGVSGEKLVILLCGGDKGSQARDIQQALTYLEDYRRRYEAVS